MIGRGLTCWMRSTKRQWNGRGTWEGVAVFPKHLKLALSLLWNPAEAQVDPQQLRRGAQDSYRKALKAELERSSFCSKGSRWRLLASNDRSDKLSVSRGIFARSSMYRRQPKARVNETRYEFSRIPNPCRPPQRSFRATSLSSTGKLSSSLKPLSRQRAKSRRELL